MDLETTVPERAIKARLSANEQFTADDTLLPRLRKLRREVVDNITSRKSVNKKTYKFLSFAISTDKYEPGAFESSGFDSWEDYIPAVRKEAFSILEVLIDHATADEATWRVDFLPGYLATLSNHATQPLVVRSALRGILLYLSRLRHTATTDELEYQHETLTSLFLPHFLFPIISRPCTDYIQEEQTEYATAIIAHLSTTRVGRKACGQYRILDALLARMLQFYVAAKDLNGFAVGAKFTITPARKSAQLGPVLAAIHTLLDNEKWARRRLVNLDFWQRIMAPEFQPEGKLGSANLKTWKTVMTPRFQPEGRARPSMKASIGPLADNAPYDPIASLVVWLNDIVRSEKGQCKIAAVSLLVGLSTMELHPLFDFYEWTMKAMLPILVSSFKIEHGSELQNIVQDDSLYVESAPVQVVQVLCTVLSYKDYIRPAVTFGIIPKLLAALSATYAVKIHTHMHKWWSPSKDDFSKPGRNIYGEEQDLILAQRPCLQIHALRGKILEALCYIIDVDESHESTKAMDELKQTGAIISCLRKSGEPEMINSKKPVGEIYTNSAAVVFMACHLIRMMGRSVKIARTTLFDFELAPSLISLLQQDDEDLEITAIGTIGNFLIEWNPHRAKLLELGVADMLYERAKSSDPRKQVASIVALKNLMYRYPAELKKDCLEKLGLLWLWLRLGGKDAAKYISAHENGADSTAMDIEPEPASKTAPQSAAVSHAPKISNDEQLEFDLLKIYPSFASGLLDRPKPRRIQIATIMFLQNLLTCEGRTACITHIFEQKTYPILQFLQHYSTLPGNRLSNPLAPAFNARSVKHVSAEHSLATLCVLTHIAGSPPNQHLLMENEKHLADLIRVLRHSSKKVRNQTVTLVSNLTVMASNADEGGCKVRAETLKKLGWLEALKVVARVDIDLDNRETAKRTIEQFTFVGVKPEE